jgi:hypothetical protein
MAHTARQLVAAVAIHLPAGDAAEVGLTAVELLDAGHPLPETGAAFVAAISQLQDRDAQRAVQRVTCPDTLVRVWSHDRRRLRAVPQLDAQVVQRRDRARSVLRMGAPPPVVT